MWTGGTGTFANANMASTTYTPTMGRNRYHRHPDLTTADPDGAAACTQCIGHGWHHHQHPCYRQRGCRSARLWQRSRSIATANGAGYVDCGTGTFANASMPASTTYTPAVAEIGTTVTLTWRPQTPMAQALYQRIGHG
ncbi:MAG: hypothetical protein R2795_13860 [Saprospiraceae bacterium]